MGSRYTDLSLTERRRRLEDLRDEQWLRQRASQVTLSDATKRRVEEHVRWLFARHRVSPSRLPDQTWRQLVETALPLEHRLEVSRAAEQYARTYAQRTFRSDTKGAPLKRYLRSARSRFQAAGLPRRQAAEALYAAAEPSARQRFEADEAEALGEPECEECNKRWGGFHFHRWDDCPLNPEND